MNRRMLSLGGFMSIAVTSLASAELITVEWDIAGESYDGASLSLYGPLQDDAWSDAVLVSWGFSDVEAEIYWNEASSFSNWASEVRLGIVDIDLGDGSGDVYYWAAAPFPDQYGAEEPGSFYHAVGGDFDSGDVSDLGYTLGSEGDISAMAYSTWDDGTGMAAGLFTSGTVWMTFDTVPAPGGLAVLGLAAMAGWGRRRH